MTLTLQNENIISLRVRITSSKLSTFINWQSSLNSSIAKFHGFVSLEIIAPQGIDANNGPLSTNSRNGSNNGSHSSDISPENSWLITQRFYDPLSAEKWLASTEHKQLMQQLGSFVQSCDIIEEVSKESSLRNGVTEVFVTRVPQEKEKNYQEWLAKIHAAEALFPGFRSVYVQSPTQNQLNKNGSGRSWITFLQFDTPDHLDHWLTSKERLNILEESHSLIETLESHRVISPFAGWFSSTMTGQIAPPLWKQTMLVLLVLFPIVMVEFKFLLPHLQGINQALSTFLANGISVCLISWPMMPLAILSLSWWLTPTEAHRKYKNVLGTIFVVLLYIIEIAYFWNNS